MGYNALVKKVKTPENSNRVDSIISYHNYRMEAGAGEESMERVMRELKALAPPEETPKEKT